MKKKERFSQSVDLVGLPTLKSGFFFYSDPPVEHSTIIVLLIEQCFTIQNAPGGGMTTLGIDPYTDLFVLDTSIVYLFCSLTLTYQSCAFPG